MGGPRWPRVYPTVPTTATADNSEQLQKQHDKARQIYNNAGTMDEALKNQVVDASEDT